MKKVPKKFHFLAVDPKPCNSEEAERHLRAFAESFINKKYIDRWIHITVERPEKAEREMCKFERHLNPKYCKMMADVDAFPLSLTEVYGTRIAVYFDGTGPASCITPAEAASLSVQKNTDALISLAPGKLAMLFFHEGWAWKCER